MFGATNSFSMSGHLAGLVRDTRKNLPRVLVRELCSSLVNATCYKTMQAEILFIDQSDAEKSAITLMGLRSQRLFCQAERAFANLLNMIHSNSYASGVYIIRIFGFIIFGFRGLPG